MKSAQYFKTQVQQCVCVVHVLLCIYTYSHSYVARSTERKSTVPASPRAGHQEAVGWDSDLLSLRENANCRAREAAAQLEGAFAPGQFHCRHSQNKGRIRSVRPACFSNPVIKRWVTSHEHLCVTHCGTHNEHVQNGSP